MDLLVTHLDTYSRLGIPKLHHLVAFEAEDEVEEGKQIIQYFYYYSKSKYICIYWYFVLKIVLTYCEKKWVSDQEKVLQIKG